MIKSLCPGRGAIKDKKYHNNISRREYRQQMLPQNLFSMDATLNILSVASISRVGNLLALNFSRGCDTPSCKKKQFNKNLEELRGNSCFTPYVRIVY